MTSFDALYERIRNLATHPVVGGVGTTYYSASAIYPTHAPAPPVPLFRNPPSSEEYQDFLLWRAQQNQHYQQQHQKQQPDQPKADLVPPPARAPPARGQHIPSNHKQQQPWFHQSTFDPALIQATHPGAALAQHVPGDINPLEPMVLTKSSIRAAHSGRLFFTITSSSTPASISSRSLLTVTRYIGGPQVGTIRFHSLSTGDADITVNGCATRLKEDGFVSTRWSFRPLSTLSPMTRKGGQKWWWLEGNEKNTLLLLTEKKHGQILARLQGDVLIFDPVEAPPPPPAILDEIVVTAVAMMEITKRSAEDVEVAAEVAGAVAGA